MNINKILVRFKNIVSVSLYDNKTVAIQGYHKDEKVEMELLAFANTLEAQELKHRLEDNLKTINETLEKIHN